MVKRSGESTTVRFRAQRFFSSSGEWFFATRENTVVGPFDSYAEAEIELIFYLRAVKYRKVSSMSEKAIINYRIPEPINQLSAGIRY